MERDRFRAHFFAHLLATVVCLLFAAVCLCASPARASSIRGGAAGLRVERERPSTGSISPDGFVSDRRRSRMHR